MSKLLKQFKVSKGESGEKRFRGLRRLFRRGRSKRLELPTSMATTSPSNIAGFISVSMLGEPGQWLQQEDEKTIVKKRKSSTVHFLDDTNASIIDDGVESLHEEEHIVGDDSLLVSALTVTPTSQNPQLKDFPCERAKNDTDCIGLSVETLDVSLKTSPQEVLKVQVSKRYLSVDGPIPFRISHPYNRRKSEGYSPSSACTEEKTKEDLGKVWPKREASETVPLTKDILNGDIPEDIPLIDEEGSTKGSLENEKETDKLTKECDENKGESNECRNYEDITAVLNERPDVEITTEDPIVERSRIYRERGISIIGSESDFFVSGPIDLQDDVEEMENESVQNKNDVSESQGFYLDAEAEVEVASPQSPSPTISNGDSEPEHDPAGTPAGQEEEEEEEGGEERDVNPAQLEYWQYVVQDAKQPKGIESTIRDYYVNLTHQKRSLSKARDSLTVVGKSFIGQIHGEVEDLTDNSDFEDKDPGVASTPDIPENSTEDSVKARLQSYKVEESIVKSRRELYENLSKASSLERFSGKKQQRSMLDLLRAENEEIKKNVMNPPTRHDPTHSSVREDHIDPVSTEEQIVQKNEDLFSESSSCHQDTIETPRKFVKKINIGGSNKTDLMQDPSSRRQGYSQYRGLLRSYTAQHSTS